jgi:type IV secretion system protein VirD4
MSKKTFAIVGGITLYVGLGIVVASYLAGVFYFLVNKSIPDNIAVDTWLRYWHAYSDDHIQRKRLQAAAGLSMIIVYVIPVIAIASLAVKTRSLHGDARFATPSEVRKSGLL